MRAGYHCLCVKFRKDDEKQQKAWELLRSRAETERKSYSRIIAEALAGNEHSVNSEGKNLEKGWDPENLCLAIGRLEESQQMIISMLERIEGQGSETGTAHRAGEDAGKQEQGHGGMSSALLSFAAGMDDE